MTWTFIHQSRERVTLMALTLTLVGCDTSVGSGTFGEVGNGTFQYECANDGDAACSGTSAIDSFRVSEDLGRRGAIPDAVAVGGIFSLSFDPNGIVDNVFRIVPASRDDERSTGQFRIEQPADAAFIAIEGTDKASDYTVLVAREAVALEVWADQDKVTKLTIAKDESVPVTVVPIDEDETLLAGALAYRWSTMNESVVSLSRYGASSGSFEVKNQGDVSLHAEGPGTTKIRVSSGDLGVEFTVEVKP